jgi:hypothetical protein
MSSAIPLSVDGFQIELRSEGGNMQDSQDAQRELIIALLAEIGGEQLAGSGFEGDEPDLAFGDTEHATEE